MIGGSLTRYDPNRGQRSTGSGRPANQTGGLCIKGLDTVRVIQSVPAALKRKAVSLTNRLPTKKRNASFAIFLHNGQTMEPTIQST